MRIFCCTLYFIVLFGISCQTSVTVKDIKLSEVSNEKQPPPPPPSGLKVSAHLVFDDSTVSSFDVLNDKSIALWNTIIGGGDATKPSNKVKVTLLGKLDSMNVKIYNGKKLVENENIRQFSGEYEFMISDVGCEEVAVLVSKQKKILFRDTIPFHCGE